MNPPVARAETPQFLLYLFVNNLALTKPQSLYHRIHSGAHIHHIPQLLYAALEQVVCWGSLPCYMNDVTIIALQNLYPLLNTSIQCMLVWKVFA